MSFLGEMNNFWFLFQVKPVIQETLGFQDVPKAYEKLAAGHSRGKIVINSE